MKWAKSKIAENCYSFFAKHKETKFDFCVTYGGGEIEIASWYDGSSNPFYEFTTDTTCDSKEFIARELELFQRKVIRDTREKMALMSEILRDAQP